jgi:mercuric ion transport protein
MTSQVDNRTARSEANSRNLDLSQKLLAGGGMLGALAASSCCLVPLALFGIGVGGAWIGYLTRLAPYQPYFLGVAAVCLGLGFWLRHRSKKVACAQDEMCARPLPSRVVTMGFVVSGLLIVAVLALDLLVPFFL